VSGNSLADCRCADSHGRQLQVNALPQSWRLRQHIGWRAGLQRAFRYTNCSLREYILPPVPMREGRQLVATDDQKERGVRLFGLQRFNCVDGVAVPFALDFTIVNADAVKPAEGQLRHFQPMLGGAQGPVFVPGEAGRDDFEFVQLQLVDGRLGQRQMRVVRRVEGATKNTDTPQTQSLRTKKSRVKAASGDSGRSSRRYDQLVSGGIDIKIDSVRPPDCKPKCVPRSQTKLNST